MITFETQEDFDAAVMAAVEKYLQIRTQVAYNIHGSIAKMSTKLSNSLSQTTFSESGRA